MTLDNWFSHIQQIHHKRIDFGLERIGIVADRLSLNYFSCPVIVVAGTNGKGSCVKTLESIYAAAGFKTALYTSPHLIDFNERIRINNKNISDEQLISAFEIVENARYDIILSFFEFITLSALVLFQQAQCDVVILEAGLGGRFDAVNIVENDVAVITSIALDHMDYLGSTLDLIAYEKASIARAGKPLICGEENPPQSIAETVSEKKAQLIQINRDFFYQTLSTNALSCAGKDFNYANLPRPHLKPQNIATAIQVIETLQNKLPITEKNIIDGIKNTYWPGRFELIDSPVSCVLDVAHNPHAAAWLAKQVQNLPPVKNTIAIVGMLKDKAVSETVSELLPCVNTWYVCSLLSECEERGSDGKDMMAFLKAQGIQSCYAFDSVEDAMNSLLHADCQRALIFGSFYTVAAAKRFFN
ncbi:MAG: bifunctional tetrahydrofolate synthase/dihydrofolate synthase [Gammaproteobacteria bacterium]|nr:bifunctional tetrahydrofolate synthase/dihydrofolate synthase [Gammaproteobacteria bacterium]